MTLSPEAWPRLKEAFEGARALAPDARPAYLAEVCEGDETLRREVELLLAHHDQAGSFLETPATPLGDRLKARTLAGQRIGLYQLSALIGAGGMGEVYSARDTRLNRLVAVKVLLPALANDPDRFARFSREAQLLASLNHPNIAQIYGVEDCGGLHALVMELVDGPTLAERLAGGALPIEEASSVAKQIAAALEAAHAQGIIHRDLKPANIKVRADGTVKVLDFGLAKAVLPASDVIATAPGVIVGTASYMSPEQARGRPVDRRSDLWAFGAVLYEMLTGQCAFPGETVSDTIVAILEREPDWAALPATVPGTVRTLIRRCLEKDERKRVADIAVAQFVLDYPENGWQRLPDVRPPATRLRLSQALIVLSLLAAAGLAGWTMRSDPAPRHTSRFAAPLPENTTFYGYVSVSPDGRKLVFTDSGGAGNRKALWIRDFSSLEWHRLPGTEGASTAFWSPDSRYVAFTAGNQLKKIDITGGPPQTLCTMPVDIEGSGAWNRNGVILFGSWGGGAGGPLWRVSETGGTATAVTDVDPSKGELYHTWPTFIEDGEHFVYFRSGTPDVEGIYVGSLDAAPAEQSRTRLLASEFPASYANGYLFFVRANMLLAQRLDWRRLTLTGEVSAVTEALETTWFRTAVFSVSPGGALAYRTGAAVDDLQLTWLDRQGRPLGTVGQPDRNTGISLSPDGSRAVVRDAPSGQMGDLWMVDLAAGRRTRWTFLRSNYSPAVWSPDGSRIAYAGGHMGDTLYQKVSAGVGDEQVLLKAPGTRHQVTSWSRDGRFLLYHTENTPATGYDLWVLPRQGDRKPVRLLGAAFNEWAGVFSPDMRWIAYASTETGGANVFVRPFLASGPSGVPAVGEGKLQISKDGGNWPKWVGQEIFFNDTPSGSSMFAARVNTSGHVLESGIPQWLFSGLLGGTRLEVGFGGQRLIGIAAPSQRATQVPITVVLNWQDALK